MVWKLYERKWLETIVTSMGCVFGIVLGAVPQMLLNHKLLGNYSWKVPTNGLMLRQMEWGIIYERYGTFIGDPAQYGSVQMFYMDAVGRAILNKEQITGLTSYGQLLKLFLKYPLDFAGIYVRHFLNMLYPIYPNQYIQDIGRNKSFLLILFYTLLFIAVVYFVRSFRLKSKRWIWFCLMLLPCVCILPGAVEIRFFIAFHFLVYMYAVLGIRDVWNEVMKQKAKYCIGYFTGFLLYLAYAGAMLGTTADGIATIH